MLKTFEENCGTVPLLTVEGEVDHANMHEFAAAVESASGLMGDKLLVDMAEVGYIDSGGLSVIYSTLHTLSEGAFLGVIAPQPRVLRILEVGGVTGHHAFRLFSSREQACQAVSTSV